MTWLRCVLSFHLDDSSMEKITKNVEEKGGEVLSYPIATTVCLYLWMFWEVFKESQHCTLKEKDSCYVSVLMSCPYVSWIPFLFSCLLISSLVWTKEDISKWPREIFIGISYSCSCLLAQHLPLDENSPSWILVIKKWEVKQFSFNFWSACTLVSGYRWMGLGTDL